MMKKLTKYSKIVIAVILFLSLFSYPQKIHADPSHTYSSTNSDVNLASRTVLFSNSAIINNDFYDQKILNTNPFYLLIESLYSNLMDKKDTINWSDDSFFNAGIPSSLGESQFESHDWEFSQINAARRNMTKKVIFESAVGVFEKTKLGKKIQRIEHSVSKYLRFEYSKTFNDKAFPGQGSFKESDILEKGYGFSFSTKLNIDTENFIDDIVFEVKSNYSSTIVNTTYELQNNVLALEFSNTYLNEYLGATAGFGLNKNPSETSCVFKICFDF